jgi:hypothetical protein
MEAETRPGPPAVMVPGVGLEPTLPYGAQILSLLRIPIPPSGPGGSFVKSTREASKS